MFAAAALVCFGRGVLGAELAFPTSKLASAGTHTLTIGPVTFDPTYGFQTRGFDSGMAGPTFRMNPGETLSITVTNNLNAANNAACTSTPGEFCKAATTNLHTHGLHVSSKGVNDGLSANSDDIFVDIQPGASASYSFTIPGNHMPGTHWYHPHHHHATALQAGGGAAGVLIVDDPSGYLPTEYSSMVEKILFISGHNLVTLQTMAVSANSGLLETAATTAQNANLDTNVFLANGQLGPTMTLASHTWHRLRMVYAAVEQTLELTVTGTATCTLKLLAKDGIYLNQIPRDVTTVYLFPGARADVAMSCTCTTYPCTGSLSSGGGGGRRMQPGGGGGAGPGAAGMNVATVTVVTLSITETAGASVATLPTVSLSRPCYLVDLRSAAVPTGNTGNLDLNGGGRVVRWNGQGTSMTYSNVHANSGTMLTWAALTNFAVGSIYEVTVTGANAHPLHIHVNPFQITSMPAASYDNGYFAVGDWHDTLMIGGLGGGGTMNIRIQTDKFTGKAVVHCHILEHEDEGMMAYISVTGTENTIWTGAATIDSTCYSLNAPQYSAVSSTGSSSGSSSATVAPSSGSSSLAFRLGSNSALAFACFVLLMVADLCTHLAS